MPPNEPSAGRSTRRDPTLADIVARRLAQLGLAWASRWILAGLFLLVALALFAVWALLLVAIAWVGGLLGLTAGDRATPFVLGAMVASGVILVRPMRWAARNLLRAERAVEGAIDGLAVPVTPDPASAVPPRPATTPDELRALDARFAAPPPSAGREDVLEEPQG